MGAGRSVEEVELEGYYVAALAFIDPQLATDASLDEVESAAARRQQALAGLPPQLSGAELAQLAEALDFVRKSHDRLQPADSPSAEDSLIPDSGGFHVGPAGDEELELGELPESILSALSNGNGNGHYNGKGNGNGAHAEVETPGHTNGHVEIVEPAPHAPVPTIEVAPGRTRRSPLSRLWEDVDKQGGEVCCLPEAQAAPVARGLVLLAAEAWLALFTGWVATRFMAWPRPGVGYDVSPLFGHVMVIVGLAAAAVAGWAIWRYRTATGKLSGLTLAGGVLVLLDLWRWYAAAVSGDTPHIPGPVGYYWELWVIGCLAAGALAYIADVRSRR